MEFQAKLLLILAVIIAASGLITMLVRRKAVWTLSGQITVLKGIMFGAAAVVAFGREGIVEELLLLILILLSITIILCAIGISVLVRCQRFRGSLDYTTETELKN